MKLGDKNKFVEIDQSFRDCAATLKTHGLSDAAAAFASNMHRVWCLDMFGVEAIRYTQDTRRILTEANKRVLGQPEWNPEIHSPDYFPKLEAVTVELLAEMQRRRSADHLDLWMARINAWVALAHAIASIPSVATAAEAILDARITGTWTAFEVLAGDLWRDAINCHPRGLSELKGTKRATVRTNDDSESAGGPEAVGDEDEGKSIQLRLIQRYKFNLAHVMGTILRAKLSFDSLVRVREAYRKAFHEDYDKIDEAINDEAIDKLYLVRNLIVHKAGIVDERFARRTRNMPEFRGLEASKPLPRNDDMALALIDPVVRCSVRLIEAVDDWIANHPD